MRVLGWLTFLALCLALVGCSSLGKKTSLPKTAKDDRPGPGAPRDDGLAAPQPVVPAGDAGSIVAGRVVDTFSNTPYSDIWIVPPADGQGAPVARHAETDRQGYFTVMNLQPGVAYHLIAQTKDGQYQQAGEVTVRPPNARVIIQVSQGSRPAIPGGGGDGWLRPSVGAPVPITPSVPQDRDPGPGAFIKPPVPATGPGSTSGGVTPIRPENFAQDPKRRRDGIELKIPGAPRPPAVAPPRPNLPPAPSGGPPLPEPGLSPISANLIVPSCDLRGKQVYNFALAGLDGEVWQYKRDRLPGTKLMLLDFWGTWCGYCRASIKSHLNQLDYLYGRHGLEIVGITYEQEPEFASQVRTVQAAKRELGIHYRLLMGCGMKTCPVMRDFGVKNFPTLVLINDKGQIIWQKEGMPNEPEFAQLQAEIRKQLGIR